MNTGSLQCRACIQYVENICKIYMNMHIHTRLRINYMKRIFVKVNFLFFCQLRPNFNMFCLSSMFFWQPTKLQKSLRQHVRKQFSLAISAARR